MSTWDYFCFSNDTVMDLLDISLNQRMVMISSADSPHPDMPLQEVIDTWYQVELADPLDALVIVGDMGFVDFNMIGIVVLLVGNSYRVPESLITQTIAVLAEYLAEKDARDYYAGQWESREKAIRAEIHLLEAYVSNP